MAPRARFWIARIISIMGWIWLGGCLLLGWLLSPAVAPMAAFDLLAVIGFIFAFALSAGLRSAA